MTGLVILFASVLGFRYFTANSLGVIVVFFLLWGNVVVAQAFFASAFFAKSRTAVIIG